MDVESGGCGSTDRPPLRGSNALAGRLQTRPLEWVKSCRGNSLNPASSFGEGIASAGLVFRRWSLQRPSANKLTKDKGLNCKDFIGEFKHFETCV